MRFDGHGIHTLWRPDGLAGRLDRRRRRSLDDAPTDSIFSRRPIGGRVHRLVVCQSHQDGRFADSSASRASGLERGQAFVAWQSASDGYHFVDDFQWRLVPQKCLYDTRYRSSGAADIHWLVCLTMAVKAGTSNTDRSAGRIQAPARPGYHRVWALRRC